MDELAYAAVRGSDYDIAKLFLTIFPNNTFTDKEISTRLSEDLWNVFHTEAINLTQKAWLGQAADTQRYMELAKSYDGIGDKLRTHSNKKRFIDEIKMIR